jgi:hypothetical protein
MSRIKQTRQALEKAGITADQAAGMTPRQLIEAAEAADPTLSTTSNDVATAKTFLE